ncbi:MAG: hypothetical protein ACTHLE_27200 [Agriterribacter sp.]
MTTVYMYLFIGVTILIIGLILGAIKYKKQSSKFNLDIPLVKTGKQLIINFADCEIKSRRYFEEKQGSVWPSRTEIMDGFYDNRKEPVKIEKEVSVILYRRPMLGRILEYKSDPVYISEAILRNILDEKRTTIIYVDRENPNKYYFDLSFLNTSNRH